MSAACQELRDAVHPLLDGELDGGRALALRMHAAACPPCAGRLAGAESLAGALAVMGRHPVMAPPDLPARILACLPARRRPWSRRGRGVLAAAVGAALAAAGVASTQLVAGIGAAPGDPALSGARAVLGGAGDWLGRFDAFFQVFYGLLELPPGLSSGPAVPTLIPALALIVAGLLGVSAAVTLSAAPRLGGQRRQAS